MIYRDFINVPNQIPFFSHTVLRLIILAAIWEIGWKGYGLWRSARNEEKQWFIAILIFNTIGILPILYIYFFAKDLKKSEK